MCVNGGKVIKLEWGRLDPWRWAEGSAARRVFTDGAKNLENNGGDEEEESELWSWWEWGREELRRASGKAGLTHTGNEWGSENGKRGGGCAQSQRGKERKLPFPIEMFPRSKRKIQCGVSTTREHQLKISAWIVHSLAQVESFTKSFSNLQVLTPILIPASISLFHTSVYPSPTKQPTPCRHQAKKNSPRSPLISNLRSKTSTSSSRLRPKKRSSFHPKRVSVF